MVIESRKDELAINRSVDRSDTKRYETFLTVDCNCLKMLNELLAVDNRLGLEEPIYREVQQIVIEPGLIIETRMGGSCIRLTACNFSGNNNRSAI